MVGSTAMAARLDVEDMHAISSAFLRACTSAVEGAGGYVARYMGDGVLAYFGYPEAHEDDAARSVAAALAMQAAAGRILTPDGSPIAVRVGIATGLVVVGEHLASGGAVERTVVGEAPNLAARLQSAAEPGEVLISDATRALAGDLFVTQARTGLSLRGIEGEISAWSVRGASAANARSSSERDGRMIGRDTELASLIRAWDRTVGGQGGLVGILGEAGIGKSRLVRALRTSIGRTAHVWLEGASAQIFQSTPFYAISRMIWRSLGPAEGAFERLAGNLAQAGLPADPAVVLIADMIGLAAPAGAPPLTLQPDERRRALLSTLTDWLLATARRWPTVMLLEDLHWADASTLELLGRIGAASRDNRLLLLFTSRGQPPAETGAADRLDLTRLDRDGSRAIIGAVGQDRLPRELVSALAAKAGGVPFFARELARLMVSRGKAAEVSDIPSRLSDLMAARLDQAGTEKGLAQVASVLGATFTPALLAQVAERGGDLEAGLEALEAQGLIRRTDDGGAYAFTHALIQDAAYSLLLRAHRRRLHARAAAVIERDFPEMAASRPEVIAQHWAGSGQGSKAVAAWSEAGRLASDRRAYAEALHALQSALEQLAGLPEGAERDERELDLQSSLATVLQITHGYSSPACAAATARARSLAEAKGDLGKQFGHVASGWAAASSAGEYAEANRLADQVLRLATTLNTPDSLGLAQLAIMTARYRVGRLLEAEEAYLKGRDLFLTDAYLRRPGAAAQTFGNAAIIAALLGDEAGADERIALSTELSLKSASPYEEAFAAYMAGMLAVIRWDYAAARPLAERSVDLSDENDYPQFSSAARVVLGRAIAETSPEEGLTLMRDGLARMGETRSKAGVSMYLTWLTEAAVLANDAAAAQSAIEEALAVNPSEAFFRPDALVARAGLQAASADQAGAEASRAQAAALAQRMGALLLHARAVAA